MAPAANWVGKAWPVERFAELALRLLGPGGALEGGRLMVLGGPGDRATRRAPCCGAVPRERLIDLDRPRTPAGALGRSWPRRALFIGGDSGLMHLAAAAGAPTLGLFGPSDETLYAPWGEHTAVARGPRSFAAIRAADPELDQRICHMIDLPVSTVLRQARALLAATAARREPPMPETYDLIVRGGEVVNHAGRGLADIGVRGGKIAARRRPLPGLAPARCSTPRA